VFGCATVFGGVRLWRRREKAPVASIPTEVSVSAE
jgi:hypothetical protein